MDSGKILVPLIEAREYDTGSYGTVFFVNDLAVKVFRRDGGDGSGEAHARKTCKDQICAYLHAMKHEALKPLVEHFMGQANIIHIRDASGNDISSSYLLNCAYVMKRLQGVQVKHDQLSNEERD